MLARALSTAVDVLFPPRCSGCGAFDTALCEPCAATMTPASGPGRCQFCCARWDGGGNCPRCVHMASMEGCRAAFEMSGAARQLVHDLKYRYVRTAAPVMANFMRDLPGGLSVDLFCPVPLHASREKERGFNQSALLLRHAGWAPVSDGLRRVRRTDRQVGSGFSERRTNIGGAFAWAGGRLDGKTVAVVDDVITTGATVAECAAVLLDAGARRVWALAFARASFAFDVAGPIDD